MRKILIAFALCLAACGDDPGWSRDELPVVAAARLVITGSSPAPCMPWEASRLEESPTETIVTFAALDTDSPTVEVLAGDDACAWDGDALACTLVRGPTGTLRVDFGAATARIDMRGDPACFTEYSITEIGAL